MLDGRLRVILFGSKARSCGFVLADRCDVGLGKQSRGKEQPQLSSERFKAFLFRSPVDLRD